MPNYGDLALNLPPTWERGGESDQNYALMIVGHKAGVADAYRTKEPDTPHQFAWVDSKYADDVAINVHKGYQFVKKDDWTKADDLWTWDAEGFCVFKMFRLMARSQERFLADMEARRKQRDRVMGSNKDEEAAEAIAARAGLEITGDDGRPLKRVRRQGMHG